MAKAARVLTAPTPHKRTSSGVQRIDLPPDATVNRAPANAEDQAPQQRRAPEPDTLSVTVRGKQLTVLSKLSCSQSSALHLVQAACERGARATSVQHCQDAAGRLTFSRVVLDASQAMGGPSAVRQAVEEAAQSLGGTLARRRVPARKRVALFVSKFDHCLYDLLLRHEKGELECEVPLIVSNHPTLQGVAERFGVEYRYIPKGPTSKSLAESMENALLEDHGVDLIVMARYMQILSSSFVQRWPHQIINIHHSFLPAFMGAKPYHRALERGVKLVGATAHYATSDLDEGPIIEQDVARCDHQDSLEDLLRKGREVERAVLSRAVRWHLEDRVVVYGNRTVVFT